MAVLRRDRAPGVAALEPDALFPDELLQGSPEDRPALGGVVDPLFQHADLAEDDVGKPDRQQQADLFVGVGHQAAGGYRAISPVFLK